MKKGLLSILASALLVVGCQNYDDQFSNLESQISALATTVAGLSQVQSDLSSLAGTVGSLSSTVNSLGDTIDTAVADGLADIQADIDAIETAVADVASSEEVSDLSDAVAASQEDLDELLANSSVFNGNVTINSEATLAAFKSIGSGLAIVNGNVNITVTAAMNHDDVQTVVNEILTVTEDFTYTAMASTILETTFNNLSGVQSLTLKQGGGYRAQTLASASNIYLNDAYKSTVTIVDFRALNNVGSIQNVGATSGSLKFNKATEMHLTALAYYSGDLDLQVKEGGVIDLTALDDLNAAGTAAVGSTWEITLDGPSSVTFSNISDGTINLSNVATVNISGFIGKSVIGAGVENLTLDGTTDLDITGAVDLVTANITGAVDTDATLTKADTTGPDVIFNSQDLTTATVAGIVGDVTALNQANLESLTVSADLNGDTLRVEGNNDLVTLVTTGAKIGNVTLKDNTDLETVTLDHVTELGKDIKGVTVAITGNTNMTSLTWGADDVSSLTLTGNTQLETIDFTGLADAGTATAVTVAVNNNKLVATAAKDTFDAAAATVDTGAFTSTSGMSTLKTYIGAVDSLASTSGVKVFFDEIESGTEQLTATAAFTDIASLAVDYTSSTNIACVIWEVAAATATAAKNQTESWYVPGGAVVNGSAAYADAGLDNVNDDITIDYPVSNDAVIAWNGTATGAEARSTVADYITYFNTNADADGFDLTMTRNGKKEHTFLVNFQDTDGTSGTVSDVGTVYMTLGTVTKIISAASFSAVSVSAGMNDVGIATVLADGINDLASFTASAGGVTGYSYVVVSSKLNAVGQETDVTPLQKWALPTSLSVSKTGGTAEWSANATNGETSYTLSIGAGAVRYAGFTVTAKNTQIGSNRSLTSIVGANFFASASKLGLSSFYNNGNIDGKSTTTVDSEIGGYIRSYANSAAGITPTGTSETRLAWL